MKEKIRKIWYGLTISWDFLLFLFFIPLALIGVFTYIDESRDFRQKILFLLFYIPIGILAAIKYCEYLKQLSEKVAKREDRKY